MNIRKKNLFAMDRTMINSFIHLRLTFYKNLDGTNKFSITFQLVIELNIFSAAHGALFSQFLPDAEFMNRYFESSDILFNKSN